MEKSHIKFSERQLRVHSRAFYTLDITVTSNCNDLAGNEQQNICRSFFPDDQKGSYFYILHALILIKSI